jgi:hypothetical protein
MNVEHAGMMTDSANLSSLRETCPIVTLSTTDHTWTVVRSSWASAVRNRQLSAQAIAGFTSWLQLSQGIRDPGPHG